MLTDYKLNVPKNSLELEVNKSYMELQLGYKAVNVLEKANTTAEANLKLIDKLFQARNVAKKPIYYPFKYV